MKYEICKRLTWLCTIVMFTVAFLLCLKGFSQHKSYLMNNAQEKWAKQGFEVVDYEGWQFDLGIVGTKYGGAKVWHRLRKQPDKGITYSGCLYRWDNEIHVYGPYAIDAIAP